MADRFFIGPYSSGLVKDKKPFLIPDEAFEELRNVYVFRDRVRKRFGSRVLNGTVDPSVQQLYNGSGNAAISVPTSAPNTPIATPAIGQIFSVGNAIFTVTGLGTPAALLSTGPGTGTFNTTTGAVTITGSSINTDVFYYPALPVMGLLPLEDSSVNDEMIIGFDTRFAYTYSGTAWERLDDMYWWTGDDSQFFWSANWRGILANEMAFFVTNYNEADGMSYYDPGTGSFTKLEPYYINNIPDNIHFKVLSARIILPFYGRLVLFNTIEEVDGGTATFRQRARWSQNGNPVDQGDPIVDNSGAWIEPPYKFGKGDAIDAPTSEAIVSAVILKDRVIVYFERSTWELVSTGNQVLPFVWQTINVELGAESTFSAVPFDKAILGVGDVGVHACNGANVERIDQKIPDQIFEIQNERQGPQRVYGVRDYSTEMVYWAMPVDTADTPTTYPNQVLVYNYRNGTWAINDDSITAFGQYQFDGTLAWNSTHLTWEDSDFAWNAGTNDGLSRNIIAGNQQGFTFIVANDINQISINAHALSITNITESGLIAELTIINHNFTTGDYVLIDYMQASGDPDSTILRLNNKKFLVVDATVNTILIDVEVSFAPGALYIGGGTIRRVSKITAKTKQYNFFLDKGFSFAVNKIDFLVDKVFPRGEVTVNSYVNDADIIVDSSILTTSPYNAIYAPMEQHQNSLWHSIYPSGFGSFLQFEITWSHEQMLDDAISDADFVLNAMVIFADPTSYRLQ